MKLTASQSHGPGFSQVISRWILQKIIIIVIKKKKKKKTKLCFDAEGTGKVNWKGVAYYNRLINYLLKKGKFSNKIKILHAKLNII